MWCCADHGLRNGIDRHLAVGLVVDGDTEEAVIRQYHPGSCHSSSSLSVTVSWSDYYSKNVSNCTSHRPYRSPFRCSWWFGRTQNRATTRQPGILCGWSCRLDQSTTGHSFSTYIISVHKYAQDIIYSCSYITDLSVSRVRAANIVRRPCSDSSNVTAPYKLSFYY